MTESCPHIRPVDLHHQTHADDFYGDLDYSWDEYIQS